VATALVAGGFGEAEGDPLASAELYDAPAGSFAPIGDTTTLAKATPRHPCATGGSSSPAVTVTTGRCAPPKPTTPPLGVSRQQDGWPPGAPATRPCG
jgi:hypothetical protein